METHARERYALMVQKYRGLRTLPTLHIHPWLAADKEHVIQKAVGASVEAVILAPHVKRHPALMIVLGEVFAQV